MTKTTDSACACRFVGSAFAVSHAQVRDELFTLWSAARAEANFAYDAWCLRPGTDAYTVYLAAEDRADAAERQLAAVAQRRRDAATRQALPVTA